MAEEQAPASQPSPGRDIFISYASQDKAVAASVCKALEGAGLTCWIAPRDVVPGESFAGAIVHAIDATKAIVLVLSEHAADSQHVLREVERAASKRHAVIAFRLDMKPLPADFEYFLNTSQWLDASAGVRRALPKLIAAVRDATSNASAAPDVVSVRTPPTSVTRGWRTALSLSLALVIAIGAYALINRFLIAKPTTSRPSSTPDRSVVGVNDNSVAVLPLKNESGDPKQEYFSDGLSENLINSLSHIPELKVIGRTSAFHFKNSLDTSVSIGRALAVAKLIEGSVQREGALVRVSVQLINAADGRTLWSEHYDRPYKNLFALQDEIAQSLAQALKARLLPSAQNAADRPPSGNLEAYRLLLQGRYYNSLGNGPSTNAAVNVLKRAIQIDPNYSAAWRELAGSYYGLAEIFYIERARNRTLCLQTFARAVALAPDDAWIRLGSAVIKIQYDHNPKGAAADIAAAEHSDPSVTLPEQLALVTGGVPGSYYDRYVRDRSATIDRDPLNAGALMDRAFARYLAGKLEEAETDYRHTIAINPEMAMARYYLATVLVAEHRPAEALAIGSEERLAVNRKAARAFSFVALGRRAEAEAELRDMVAHYADDGPKEIAEVYAALGEKKQALDWLQKDYDGHHVGMFSLRSDPMLRSVADEPRFKALMNRIWPGT